MEGLLRRHGVVGCEYLQKVDRHDLRRLLDVIRTRIDRMAFERIIACLLKCRGRNKARAATPSLFETFTDRVGGENRSTQLSASDLKKPIIKVDGR